MKRQIFVVIVTALTVAGCAQSNAGLSDSRGILSGAGISPSAVQPSALTAYTFNLAGPNTAEAESGPFTGDTIRVTGDGAFDPTSGTIAGDGSFTHIKSDGTVFARGTWRATGFTSFTPFGGPNPGTQGGVLWFTATLFPDGEPPVPGVPVSVTCGVNNPGGFEEGTTVGAFTEKTGGLTVFHKRA